MKDKPVIRYEDNAEQATVTGWICKTCRRWYGYDDAAEHAASYCCCTDRPCSTDGCTDRAEKSRIYCKSCDAKRDTERYYAKSEVDWDGETPLMSDTHGDLYFWHLEELLDHLETDSPTDDQIEELRLLICKPHKTRLFDLDDFLCDDLSEDCDPPGDWKAIEKIVNDYIEANSPMSWEASNRRPSLASIRKVIGERMRQ
jgi:hypothetical protein